MTQQVLARLPPRDWQAASAAFSHPHPATSADGCESASAGLSPNVISSRSRQGTPPVVPVSRRLVSRVGEFLFLCCNFCGDAHMLVRRRALDRQNEMRLKDEQSPKISFPSSASLELEFSRGQHLNVELKNAIPSLPTGWRQQLVVYTRGHQPF